MHKFSNIIRGNYATPAAALKEVRRTASVLDQRGVTHWWNPRTCFSDAGGTTVPADAGEVLRANDLGPAATNATATATNGLTYIANWKNGLPGWNSTSGTTDALVAAGALSAAYASAFSVYVVIGGTNNDDTRVAVGGADWYLLKGARKLYGGNVGDLTDAQTDVSEDVLTQFAVLHMVWDGTTRMVGMNGHYTTEAATGTLNPAADLRIGSLSGGFPWIDGIGDVVVANAAHSIDEVHQMVSILHGIYSKHSTIVCDGDSILMGGGSEPLDQYAASLGAEIEAALPEYAMNNYGISGQAIADMDADQATSISRCRLPVAKNNVVFCFGGTNDIEGGASAATVYADMVTYSTACRAAGQKVIVGTIIDRDWGSSDAAKDIVRAQVNAMIRAQGVDDFDGVADFAARAEFQDASDTDYFMTDDIHPNAAGCALLAEILATEVRRISA